MPSKLIGVFDGLSFAITDKTITDHGISAVTGKDCALTRILMKDRICLE